MNLIYNYTFRSSVKPKQPAIPLFKGGPSETTITVGNWILKCRLVIFLSEDFPILDKYTHLAAID